MKKKILIQVQYRGKRFTKIQEVTAAPSSTIDLVRSHFKHLQMGVVDGLSYVLVRVEGMIRIIFKDNTNYILS